MKVDSAGDPTGSISPASIAFADIDEPIRKGVRHVLGLYRTRHQKSAVAIADDRFELRQMHGDDGPTDGQGFKNETRHAFELGRENASMRAGQRRSHSRRILEAMANGDVLDRREFGKAVRITGADVVKFDAAASVAAASDRWRGTSAAGSLNSSSRPANTIRNGDVLIGQRLRLEIYRC